jgi:fructan beta-fructosidase
MKNLFLLLLLVAMACSKKTADTSIAEQHRPQFHFTPQKGWMNDPNGLVYADGVYHLFYQHYPDSTVWGPMHWGHASSADLVHWEQHPIALAPDTLGYIFSGSIVLDSLNTSGFGDGKIAPMVAIFTYHNMEFEKAGRKDRESQGIAYSLDKGMTWTKYAQNPVLANKGDQDFRDPKVFWHAASKRWIMPLAVGEHLEIFTSENLKNWQKTSDFGKKDGNHGGVWECPDLFPIKADDGSEKWVLVQNIGRGAIAGGSGTQYFVGNFDGKSFKNDNPPSQTLWMDYGADNYAGVSWFNAPNNRRIQIGWMSNWDDYATKVPTSTWRSGMTVPRELTLKKTADGFRIFQEPVKEAAILRGNQTQIASQIIKDSLIISERGSLKELDLSFDLANSTATEIGFILKNKRNERFIVGYDKARNEVFIDRRLAGKSSFSDKFAKRHTAPLKNTKTLTIKGLIDVASAEIFFQNGKIAMTDLFFPNEDYETILLYAKGGSTKLNTSSIYDLKK